jgi:hypothetical protein
VSQDFASQVSEALTIIQTAQSKGATLRLMGGLAIKIHTKKQPDLCERLGRAPGDIDLMALKKESIKVKEVMKSLGYRPNQQLNALHGHKRQLWYSHQNQIDILFDFFEMCHTMDLRDRLAIDFPTLSPSDLFLQKAQIIRINEKDIKDLYILLLEHDLGEDEDDKINLQYVSRLLSDDWGFWYTTLQTLQKICNLIATYDQLAQKEKNDILAKINIVVDRLKSCPKSFRWRARERVGTKVRWYNEVEEVVRWANATA